MLALLLALLVVAQPAMPLAVVAAGATSCGSSAPEASCCASEAPSCCCGVPGENRCGSEPRSVAPRGEAPVLLVCDCGADPLPLAPTPPQRGVRCGADAADAEASTTSGAADPVTARTPERAARSVACPRMGAASRGCAPGEWRPPRILHGVWRN